MRRRFLVLCEQYGSHKMVGLADYRRAHGALSGRGIEWELILVDDDSNDGSEQMVAELARRLPVRLATRRGAPRDLSLSVLLGVRLARFDRCLGADLSHPPECIVELLSGLDADCDMVVGSRYASGGVVDSNWSRRRLLTSRLGIWLARPLGSAVRSAIGTRSPSRRRSLSARLHDVVTAPVTTEVV